MTTMLLSRFMDGRIPLVRPVPHAHRDRQQGDHCPPRRQRRGHEEEAQPRREPPRDSALLPELRAPGREAWTRRASTARSRTRSTWTAHTARVSFVRRQPAGLRADGELPHAREASRTRGGRDRRVVDADPTLDPCSDTPSCGFAGAGGRFRLDRVLGRLDVRRMLEPGRVFCHVSCIPRGTWGRSSVGRAPALQAGSRGFESRRLHHRVWCFG
jgi:hypothetical protein